MNSRCFSPNWRQTMARLSKATLIGLLLFLSACTSSKVLNESRAKALIGEALQKASYMTSAGSITPLMSRSTNDYRATTVSAGPGHTLKRLIEEKLVTQKVETVNHPKVSGTFVSRWFYNTYAYSWRSNQSQRLHFRTEFSLTTDSVKQDLVHVTGKHGKSIGPPSWDLIPGSGWIELVPMIGRVDPDGSVHLPSATWIGSLTSVPPGPPIEGDLNFQYREEGATAYLQETRQDQLLCADCYSPTGRRTFAGTASGKKVEVKWYEYTFSPEVQTSAGRQGIEVAAGRFQVGEVSNLQLVNDTHAVANFAWDAQLNKIGQIMLADVKPSGTSTAQFAKKPDGTWVINEFGRDFSNSTLTRQ